MINTPTTESESNISNPVVTDQLRYRKEIIDKLKLQGKDKMWYAHYKYMDIVNELEPVFDYLGSGLESNHTGKEFDLGEQLPTSIKKHISEYLDIVYRSETDITKVLTDWFGIMKEEQKISGYEFFKKFFIKQISNLTKEEIKQVKEMLNFSLHRNQIANCVILSGEEDNINRLISLVYHNPKEVKKGVRAFGGGIYLNATSNSGKYLGFALVHNNKKDGGGLIKEIRKHETKHHIDFMYGINKGIYSKNTNSFNLEKVIASEILAYDWQRSDLSKEDLWTNLINYVTYNCNIEDPSELSRINNGGYLELDKGKTYSFTKTENESKIISEIGMFCKTLNKLVNSLYNIRLVAKEKPQFGLNNKKINILLSTIPSTYRSKISRYYIDLYTNDEIQELKKQRSLKNANH